jgi:NCAIR mutase (PurE)-related protein
MNPTTVLAEVIVDQLILNGVKEVVVAPGSRNAPITMAFFRAHQAGRVRLHSRIDGNTLEIKKKIIQRFQEMKQAEDTKTLDSLMDYKSNSFHYRYQHQTLETNLLL